MQLFLKRRAFRPHQAASSGIEAPQLALPPYDGSFEIYPLDA
jgi:hypothetical protein